jgi:hypothetical protein
MLTKENLPEALKPGFLDKHTLAPTISDAILLMERLGEKYIWIDSLRIIQDDIEHKKRLIPAMNAIYRNSSYTVIAACGDSANAPLAGLRPGTRSRIQKTTRIGDFHIITCLDPRHAEDNVIIKSKWASRGWTFQERLLARRCLIFTPHQVYWGCKISLTREDIITESLRSTGYVDSKGTTRPFYSMTLSGVGDISHTVNEWMMRFANEFAKRQLTHESDAPLAIAGILSEIARTSDISVKGIEWGTVRANFNANVLWFGNPLNTPRNADLPSWSWVSWKDEIVNPPKHIPTIESYWKVTKDGKDILEMVEILPDIRYNHNMYAVDRTDKKSGILEKGDDTIASLSQKQQEDFLAIMTPRRQLLFLAEIGSVEIIEGTSEKGKKMSIIQTADETRRRLGTLDGIPSICEPEKVTKCQAIVMGRMAHPCLLLLGQRRSLRVSDRLLIMLVKSQDNIFKRITMFRLDLEKWVAVNPKLKWIILD